MEAVDKKLHELLKTAEANAGYNSRDIIWLSSAPLTSAIRESMQQFLGIEDELKKSLKILDLIT